MNRFALVVIPVSLIFAGCGETPATPANPAQPATPAPAATPAAAPATTADYSTPTATVNTWIKACAAKDKDLIAAAISADTKDGDLKEIRSKSGTDRNYQELADSMGKGTVTGETINPAGDEAMVKVKMERDETIKLVKKDGRWWINDL